MTIQSSQLHGTTMYQGKTLPMTLLPGENVLLAWETQARREELIVTTHRVQHSRRAIGRRWKTNIMLDSITACSLEFCSCVLYIVLAVLAVIVGLGFAFDNGPGPIIGGVVAGLVFVFLYRRSRDQVVEFTTAGATIKVGSSGRSLEEVRQLVETVEAAKNARYMQRLSPGCVAHTAVQADVAPSA
jgi:hypothetical protein